MPQHEPAATRPGVFAPFQHRVFLAIWIANLASNFGSLIQGVGASWLMTSLDPAARMVTLVAAASALPLVLFSLVAGAAADVWDRRSVMLAAQTLMLLVSVALTVLTRRGLVTPWLLLVLTFLLGCGAALNGPAWQASVGEQVPRGDLAGAITLNDLGFNLARAVAPALGGVVVATAGPEAAFVLNTASYLGLIVVLARWRRPAPARDLPPESIPSATRAGLWYAVWSPAIRIVMLRALVFGFFASAVLALLPLVARDQLGGGPSTYGLLLGAFGAGAVGGGLLSRRLRDRFSNEALLRAASLASAVSVSGVGVSRALPLTLGALLVGGAAWVLALTMFTVIVQLSIPRWVVGRANAALQMITYAGLAAGSLGWGLLTESRGLTPSLVVSGVGLAASALLGLRFPIGREQAAETTEPLVLPDYSHRGVVVDARSGPIVATVQYCVADEDAAAFVAAMWEMRRIRRRDGGRGWVLLRDLADPTVWVEQFESRTWLDHLRQFTRGMIADGEVRQRVRSLHRSAEPPPVRYMLARHPGAFAAGGDDATDVLAAHGTTDPLLPSANVWHARHAGAGAGAQKTAGTA